MCLRGAMKTTKNTIPVLTFKKVVSLRKVLLAVYCPYKTKIKELIKNIGGYYFSNTLKTWYILHRRNNLMILKKNEGLQKKS